MHFESFNKYELYLNTEIKKYEVLENMFNTLVNVSMQVLKTRMDTDGKGETVAVADNKTKEGKARNRRVEFIKL